MIHIFGETWKLWIIVLTALLSLSTSNIYYKEEVDSIIKCCLNISETLRSKDDSYNVRDVSEFPEDSVNLPRFGSTQDELQKTGTFLTFIITCLCFVSKYLHTLDIN